MTRAPPKKAQAKKRPGTKSDRFKRSTADEIRRAERRLAALEYRKAGHTYAKIGKWLEPPCNRETANKLVLEALAEFKADTVELVEHVRAMELQRLDDMLVKPFEAAKLGDTRAVDAVLKIMERRAQIMGSDAPSKTEHSGPGGGPIISRVERVIVYPDHPAVRDGGVGDPVPAAKPV